MKICVAQTKPVKGNIAANIEAHKKLISLAVSKNAAIIIFPELSVTGYEPELAKELATHKDDNRFDEFQEISDEKNIIIGIGMPLNSDAGITISMILFQPQTPRRVYSKQYLHEDELPYFITGKEQVILKRDNIKISFAICYELFIPEHSANASKNGVQVYIASTAKSANGVEKAGKTLPDIAGNYSMTVLMSNCVGYCDNFEAAGKTSAWNNKGELAGQLNDKEEGILVYDTSTLAII